MHIRYMARIHTNGMVLRMKTLHLHKTKERSVTIYTYTGESICYNCKAEIYYVAFYIMDWNPKKTQSYLYCNACVRQKPPNMYSQDQLRVLIARKPPHNSVPVILTPPTLTNHNNQTIFTRATYEEGETTIDNTKIANKTNIPTIEEQETKKQLR